MCGPYDISPPTKTGGFTPYIVGRRLRAASATSSALQQFVSGPGKTMTPSAPLAFAARTARSNSLRSPTFSICSLMRDAEAASSRLVQSP